MRRALGALPGVTFLEFDWPLMTSLHARYGGAVPAGARAREGFISDVFGHPKFQRCAVSAQADELAEMVRAGQFTRVVDVLREVMRRLSTDAGGAVPGVKSPGLERSFPELVGELGVQAVYVYRNPVDVAASAYGYRDWHRAASDVALAWRRSVRAAERARHQFPEAVHFVRYEDLVTAPEEQLQRLCGAIGVAFSPASLSDAVFGRTNSSFRSEDYDRDALRGQSERAVATVAGTDARRYGYPVPPGNGAKHTTMVLAAAARASAREARTAAGRVVRRMQSGR